MVPFFIILYMLYFVDVKHKTQPILPPSNEDGLKCSSFEVNFTNITDILGTWHVVALIPGNNFPRYSEIWCYKMEITEADEASVKWLVRKKIKSVNDLIISNEVKGIVIRQRYHSHRAFDIWSKYMPTGKGCFKQLLSLQARKTSIHDAEPLENIMQFHIMHHDEFGPYLIQILWGKIISAVIYRRTPGASLERVMPIYEYLLKKRPYENLPRTCTPLKWEIVPPLNQRP